MPEICCPSTGMSNWLSNVGNSSWLIWKITFTNISILSWLTNVGILYTNIGIPFLFDQHWMTQYQYWHIIFVWPTLDDSIPILAYHFCLTNVGIYNTLPILVCHSLIPKINQIYANENHIISLHWNLKYFPVHNNTSRRLGKKITELSPQS